MNSLDFVPLRRNKALYLTTNKTRMLFDEICYFSIHLQCYLFQIAQKMRARQRYLRDLKRAIHKSGKRSYQPLSICC